MKIRKGFVSNSSSSSFIIDNTNAHTKIEDIVRNMVNTVIEYREDDSQLIDSWLDRIEVAVQVAKEKGVGITFPSCNYNTYIIEHNDHIYISTCNNYTWEIDSKDIENDNKMFEKMSNVMDNAYYYDLRNGMIHSMEKYDDHGKVGNCPCCGKNWFGHVVTEDGEEVCLECMNGTLDGKILKKKSFLILPVRGHNMLETEGVVKDLENQGYEVHWPPRDTNQIDDTGFRICTDNTEAIRKADVVHVIWDGKSQGGLFDLGVAFAMKKKIITISLPDPSDGKSFQNMIREWAEKTKETQ